MAAAVENLRVKLPFTGKFVRVHELMDGLNISEQVMHQIMDVMESEMRKGLSSSEEARRTSSLQMENTFVHETINGTEHGDFLALDLGGTNFRVIFAQLRNGVLIDTKTHNYEIPASILKGTGESLFDYLAECISTLIRQENITSDSSLPLGFTFSFPMVQKSLNSALLLTWTKSFSCSDTVMKDVVQMLSEAIARRGDLNVHVVAILNDAVGTLMTGAYVDHRCAIGLIMGTGCNASYMEHLERVEKWQGTQVEGLREIIDIEWGAFGDNGVLDFFKTEYDFEIDRGSNHQGSFTFEKLFAGLYLGELVRVCLAKLCSEGLAFDRERDSWVFQKNSFPTKYVSTIESEPEDSTELTLEILKGLSIVNPSHDDMMVLKYLCALVSNRAAKIISSVLCVLLKHIKKEEVTIAVDGSLYEFHPTIRPQMEQILAYMEPGTTARFVGVKDGSGVGAAYVAAVAHRIAKEGLTASH